MNSLKVSWDEPKQRNGEITGYVVTYETAQQDETFSKQVKQKVTTTWLVVGNLEEEVTYYFSVRASTYELGAPSTGNVTTGPQEGSPGTCSGRTAHRARDPSWATTSKARRKVTIVEHVPVQLKFQNHSFLSNHALAERLVTKLVSFISFFIS